MKNFLAIFLSLAIISCSSKDKQPKTAISAYKDAMEILKDKSYIEAAEKFEEIYDDYPLSKWSIKAQTIAAYAYYKEKRYEDVIRVSQTFVELNPSSKYIPYLEYMKSISYFYMIPQVDRGQNYTKMASYNFRELVARYPYSKYIKDAKDKILIIDEHLAGSKMSVGRYQMTRGNYIGAILHFDNVLARYSRTNQAAEAYFRLYEIYYHLGMNNEAQRIKKEMLEVHKDGIWVNKIKS